MKSAVRFHFPQVVFEKHQKKLFNPVLKKRFVNRPEERVRLKWVEYLLFEVNWNRNRISFESPVTVQQSENKQRADLILYSEDMKPYILIECKSEKIRLTEKAGEQAARYNTDVSAPYLILTNGIVDQSFEIRKGRAIAITNLFSEAPETFKRDSIYWSERGFSGFKNNESDLDCPSFLNKFWSNSLDTNVRYLSFQTTHIGIPIDQYYRIFQIDHETKLAVSMVGQGNSETFLVAVMNQKGVNRAIVYININKWIENSPEAVKKVDEKGEVTGEVQASLLGYFSKIKPSVLTNFSNDVMKLF